MRVDARNLLDRLGRSNFSYKEFEDRFTELELWPLLEALLRDPRLQALDGTRVSMTEARAEEARPMESDSPFRRYEAAAPASQSRESARSQQDVRAMLRRLSELGDKGEL